MKHILFLFFILRSLTVFSQKDTAFSSELKSVIEYEVTPLNKINTRRSEFSPVKYGNGIVFVGEQKEDLIHLESMDSDGHPYLDLYYSEKNNQGKYSSKKTYTKGLNTNFHDGPVSFSADLNEAYLTRTEYVVKDKNYTNQSKLYFLKRKGTHWGQPEKFIYDSDEYSLGHASVSKDGKLLFFSSDMPGGFGGTDIYVCERKGNTWDKPKNLGPKINTSGMELFPHIRKDGVLFYSSDKLDGFGGLDIFSAELANNEWQLIRNEGLGINSNSDDFGIYFSDTANGYFSSNRQGSDDIFSFYFERKFIDFEGYVLNSKDSSDVANNIKIDLKDKNGNTVTSVRTTKNGYFKFSNLKTNESFLIDIDETDGLFNNKLKYYLTDKKRSIVRETQSDDYNKFVFKNLSIDSNSNMNNDLVEDEKVISGTLIFNTTQSPLAKIKIVAKDEGGKIIDEATTDENGKFVFKNIPPGASVLIELAEQDTQLPADTEIALKNLKGKTIKIIKTGSDGKFTMNLLRKESISTSDLFEEDTPITLVFNATVYDDQNKTIPKLKVILKDEKGNIVATQVTDANGKITFKKLDPDKNYLMDFDVNDTRLNAYTKIVLKADDGSVIKEVYKNAKGFEYQILKGDKAGITEIKEEDTDFTLAFKALVYDESLNLLPNLKVVLKDEKGNIVYRDSTDKTGKITFNKLFADKSYLIEFDEKDTRLGNVSKIIIKSQNNRTVKEVVKNNNGFQYKILNGEKSLLKELEIEDAPLTFVFKSLVYDETMKILPNLIVYLKDENGKLISTDTSDANGKINFNQLIADKNYQIEFDEKDDRLKFIKKIVFKSENNKVVKEIVRTEKGFVYKILKGDKIDLMLNDANFSDIDLKLNFKALVYDQSLKLLPNLTFYLKDENGKEVAKKTTDANALIDLKDLISNKNYIIEFDVNDERVKGISKIIIKSFDKKLVKEIIKTDNSFAFKILAGEQPSFYQDETSDTELTMELKAIVCDETMKIIPDLMIYLKDENGKLVSKKMTDKNGRVNLKEIKSNENYIIEFDENDSRLKMINKIIIKSINYKIVKEIIKNKSEFTFNLLKGEYPELFLSDQMDKMFDLEYKAIVYDETLNLLPDLKIYLKDENGKLIFEKITDKNGKVSIKELLSDKNYTIEFDQNDKRLTGINKIIIKSTNNKIVKEIVRNQSGFTFTLLKGEYPELYQDDITEPFINMEFNATVYNESMKEIPDLMIYFKGENGTLIKKKMTDKNGKIKINDISSTNNYLIEFDENDSRLSSLNKIIIKSPTSNTVIELKRTEKGFNYILLSGDKIFLNDADALKDEELMKINFSAYIYDDQNKVLSNLVLYLKDQNKKLVKTDTTNLYGGIIFNELLADQNYFIEFDENDERLKNISKISIKSNDGRVIREVERSSTGFEFHLLKSDQSFISYINTEDDINIKLDFKATILDDKNKILSNLIVYLKDEKGNVIITDSTDSRGKIKFNDLLANQSHIVEFDEKNPSIANVSKIFIQSENGKMIREINRNNKGFTYNINKVEEEKNTKEFSVDDILNLSTNSIEEYFKTQIKIKENISYKVGDVSVSESDKSYLDKLIVLMKKSEKLQLEISGFADSRSSEKVNLLITEKRANASANYVVSKGIERKRITTIAYGESRLKNKCPDFSECTEEQHAENRRTEYRLVVKP